MRITAGSTSVRAFERPLREAAAVARTMLVGAAADRWNVMPSECEAADGFVINGARTFTFGELAEEAAEPQLRRSSPQLRQRPNPRLIGQPLQRLDGPAKANGSLRFAADVRLPDMLFAVGPDRAAGRAPAQLSSATPSVACPAFAMSPRATDGSRSSPIAGGSRSRR